MYVFILSSSCSIYTYLHYVPENRKKGRCYFPDWSAPFILSVTWCQVDNDGNGDVNNEANTVWTTAECSREEHARVPGIYNPWCDEVDGLIIL